MSLEEAEEEATRLLLLLSLCESKAMDSVLVDFPSLLVCGSLVGIDSKLARA